MVDINKKSEAQLKFELSFVLHTMGWKIRLEAQDKIKNTNKRNIYDIVLIDKNNVIRHIIEVKRSKGGSYFNNINLKSNQYYRFTGCGKISYKKITPQIKKYIQNIDLNNCDFWYIGLNSEWLKSKIAKKWLLHVGKQ